LQHFFTKVKSQLSNKENITKIIFTLISLVLLLFISYFTLVAASADMKSKNFALVAFLIIILGLSRKAFWLLAFPITLLHAIYLPVAIIFGRINYEYIASINDTNLRETREFFKLLEGKYILISILMIVALVAYRFITKRYNINFAKNRFLLILLVMIAMSSQAPLQHPREALESMKMILKEQRLLHNLKQNSSWSEVASSPKYDTYVLVIGESARQDYMGAYGYSVDTTPFMSSSNGVLVDGLIAGGFNTVSSLRVMLTNAQKRFGGEPNYEQDLISLANSAGFETIWISNQSYLGKHDTPITAIADASHAKHFLKSGKYSSENTDDMDLLPIFADELAKKSTKPRLIVLHLYGSHTSTCERLQGFSNNFIIPDPNYTNLSCYLASIEKTDFLLSKLNDELQKQLDKDAKGYSMIYFSDHGLSHKYRGKELILGHFETKEQFMIPLFKLSSDDTKHTLISSYKSPLNFTNALANWLGISSADLDPNYDLFASGDDDDYGYDKYLKTLPSDPALVYQNLCFDKEYMSQKANEFAKDKHRFIAHAGGAINGNIYTNSLEALDENYAKGFKLFELDLVETSDGHIVALHEWKKYPQQSGYKGKLPPTLAEFKSHKILGRYTPMDLDDINRWFEAHSDAILVTDKINTPALFASKFVDPSRLYMELFSWDALKEATSVDKITPMATFGLVKRLPSSTNKAKHLKDLGIEYVVSNRNMDKLVAQELTNEGIKIYAYILGDEVRERQTICDESAYFYGIYADEFMFDEKIDCSMF